MSKLFLGSAATLEPILDGAHWHPGSPDDLGALLARIAFGDQFTQPRY